MTSREPTPFSPDLPHSTFWLKCGWNFSRVGRIRLRIIRCCKKQLVDSTWKNLEKDSALLAELIKKGKADISEWHELILSCLVNHYIHAKDLKKGINWIMQLAKGFPGSAYIHHLRWAIVKQAVGDRETDVFFNQAKYFLIDKHVTINHIDAIHFILLNAYEKGDKRKFIEILNCANEGIRYSSVILEAKALCQTPSDFSTVKEVREWTERINPDTFAFSRTMHSDALIVSARAAEWSGNFNEMAELAENAYHLNSVGLNQNYWRLRSLLQKAVFSDKGIVEDSVPEHLRQEWIRLRIEYALHRKPGLERAEDLLSTLSSCFSQMEAPEKNLSLKLLQKTLTVNLSSTAKVIVDTVRLCKMVEDLSGRQLPWTQYSIAVKELIVDNSPAKALRRLNDIREFQSTSTVPIVKKVAQVIIGQSKDCRSLMEKNLFSGMKDPLFLKIPLLGELRKIIAMPYRAINRDPSVCDDLMDHYILPAAPPWFGWLFVRSCALALEPDDLMKIIKRIGFRNRLVAWEIARWADEGGPFSARNDPAVLKAKGLIEGISWGSFCESPNEMVGLGMLPDAVLSKDRALSAEFFSARNSIREGNMVIARKQLADILKDIGKSDPVIESWWKPLCEYWLGVAEAHMGTSESDDHLKHAVESWVGSKARSQLALLAVRDKDYQRAESWLQEAHPGYPGVQYARALILARKGEVDASRKLIDDYENLFPGDTSPYSFACRRLSAALNERTGAKDKAKAEYLITYTADPDDSLLSARLARILLEDLYRMTGKTTEEDRRILIKILTGSESIITKAPWFRAYTQLSEVMVINADAKSISRKIGLDSSQIRIALRQLLHARKGDGALEVLKSNDLDDQTRHAKGILYAWYLLSSIWKPGVVNETFEDRSLSDALDACLEYIAATRGKNGNHESARWSSLLRLAQRIVQNPEDYSGFSSQKLLEKLPSMISDGLNERQKDMALAIVSLSSDEKAGFLKAYQRLSYDLDTLPIDGRDLWINAAEKWFETRQINELLKSKLPACIEDLADPHVRTIIGMAYAQACTIYFSNGDLPRAAKNISMARSTLEPLFEEMGG